MAVWSPFLHSDKRGNRILTGCGGHFSLRMAWNDNMHPKEVAGRLNEIRLVIAQPRSCDLSTASLFFDNTLNESFSRNHSLSFHRMVICICLLRPRGTWTTRRIIKRWVKAAEKNYIARVYRIYVALHSLVLSRCSAGIRTRVAGSGASTWLPLLFPGPAPVSVGFCKFTAFADTKETKY